MTIPPPELFLKKNKNNKQSNAKTMKKNCKNKGKLVILTFLCVLFSKAQAQSVSNYTVSRSTGITFNTISTTGTSITSWRNSTSIDDNRSNSVTIPFDFWYLGVKYTSLCASTNGFVDFSSSTANGASFSGAYGYVNTAFSAAAGSLLTLAPLYDDLKVTTLNSDVKYLGAGTYPNRTFTVEWLNTKNTGGTGTYNFQVVLHEGTGIIDFIYASTMVTNLSSYSCGINGASISATPTASELLTQTTANSTTFSNTVSNSLTTVPTASSKITFTPSQAATPTGLTVTATSTTASLSWTDAATNELGYVIYYSTSATGGFVPLSSASTLVTTYQNTPSTIAATISGLAMNTTYYFNVFALKESLSSAATGNITTPCLSPVTQANSTLFSTVLGTAMTINCGVGSGTGRVIKINTTNSFTNPLDGTDPSASSTYAGGEQVVYNGAGTSVTVLGLSTSTTYYVSIYEYNCSGASIVFNTTSPAIGNQTTSSVMNYTWTGTTGGSWATTTNWTPNGTPTTGNSVLINTSVTIISVPTVTIGSLLVNANCSAVLEGGTTTTLTIGDITGTDLTVTSGSTLTCGTGLNMTLAVSATADISGTFVINTSRTFNTQGASSITTINGTITNRGTLTCSTNSNLIFTQTATYDHAVDGGVVPKATWNSGTPGATCIISGCVASKPTGLATTSNTFNHLTWNSTSQSLNLRGGSCLVQSGENMTCNGNFTVTSTNSKEMAFSEITGGSLSMFTIGGNMVLNNSGVFDFNQTTTPVTFNITGNLNIANCQVCCHGGNTGATTSINVSGNINLSSGFLIGAWSNYSGLTVNVTNDFNITGGTFYGNYSGIGNPAFNISRDLNVSGGTFNGSNNTGSPVYTVTRDINISGGTFYGTDNAGSPTYTVGRNISLSGTGVFKGSDVSTGDPVFTIIGSLTSAGTATFYASRISGGNPVFNIQGNVDLATGTIAAANNYTSNTSVCTFNLTGSGSGNLKLPTGLVYNTSAAWTWNINSGRSVTLQSNVELGGTGNGCVFTNNGTLIMGTYTFPTITSAVASFVNASGAILKTAHLSGLSTTASTGSIQVSGTKTFSSAASYVFNGTAAQVTGNFGSSTTPVASSVLTMETNNTFGVTLTESIAVTSTLTLTAGVIKTVANTLTIGSNSGNGSIVGASSSNYIVAYDNSGVIGFLKQCINTAGGTSYSYPIGDASNYTPLTFTLSTASLTNASLTVYTKPTYIPGLNLAMTGYINRYWEITPVGITTPDYSVSYTYMDADIINGPESGLLPIKKSGVTWYKPTQGVYLTGTAQGSGAVNTASNLLTWTGLSTFSSLSGAVNDVVALPIELISFTGYKAGINNELKWITSSEYINDYFTIEKTIDGFVFETIGTVDGQGTSNEFEEYSLIDNNVFRVINYYRLKQTDFDGNYTYSELISIDNTDDQSVKKVIKITNLLGQEINDDYRGGIIILYSDGSTLKEFRN